MLVTLNKHSSLKANYMAPFNIIHGNGVAALSKKYFLLWNACLKVYKEFLQVDIVWLMANFF